MEAAGDGNKSTKRLFGVFKSTTTWKYWLHGKVSWKINLNLRKFWRVGENLIYFAQTEVRWMYWLFSRMHILKKLNKTAKSTNKIIVRKSIAKYATFHLSISTLMCIFMLICVFIYSYIYLFVCLFGYNKRIHCQLFALKCLVSCFWVFSYSSWIR